MKNLNKIGQYIAASAGAALLASFATLATPKTASAATLSLNESGEWVSSAEGEAIDEILGLEISNKKYNVKFQSMTFEEIDTYLKKQSVDAEKAAGAIVKALGSDFATGAWRGSGGRVVWYDSFSVIEELDIEEFHWGHNFNILRWTDISSSDTEVDVVTQERIVEGSVGDSQIQWRGVAVFEEANEAKVAAASTPEPSLIFGFITLGGLMLGSKSKTNG